MSEGLKRTASTAQVVEALVKARNAHAEFLPGKPCMAVPIDALHFYDMDGTLKCVLDMEQIIYLAENMLCKVPKRQEATT